MRLALEGTPHTAEATNVTPSNARKPAILPLFFFCLTQEIIRNLKIPHSISPQQPNNQDGCMREDGTPPCPGGCIEASGMAVQV
jgi:hypothetical protein